jgi:putative membrane-bound dehydrogenase-like protein
MPFSFKLDSFAALLFFALASNFAVADGDWKKVTVPTVWKRPPGEIEGAGRGFAWYRCQVNIPSHWLGREVTAIAESADDARQYYLNGKLLGQSGNFPPTYRSGLGETIRLRVTRDQIKAGLNVFAIRCCQQAARVNFNVAAPAIVSADQGIRMRGDWEFQPGDLSVKSVAEADYGLKPFAKLDSAQALEKTFKKLENDEGALAPAEALARMKVPSDLAADLAIAEPHVRQPLSIKWDEKGRLWVMQYLQYPTPAGIKMVSRDKYLRTVYDKMPPAPPNHFRGADKITIHEDTDGDGQFDSHKTFVDGLSLASSFAIGRGGLFVLNPPYLLFYPDKDKNDKPDGDPQVLLQGFGIEDSHSIANSLRWGPDGWLYAAQGSTVTGAIRKPSQKPEEAVHSMGQLIWRYHPETAKYEIFAEGGGNAFGVEVDAKGRIYSGHNGGDTRGFHYVQGGYFRKGFGKHGPLSNPFAYGYFANMAHHEVARFTHTFVIYDGGSLPSSYVGRLFGVAPLQGHVVTSDVALDRSSFKTKDIGHVLTTDDKWFRPVDIQVGPDGAMYVVDLYEQRIDHSSHYQGRVHRDSGRIYRIRAKNAAAGMKPFDLAKLSTRQLVDQLSSGNKWRRQTALRLLGDRKDLSAVQLLRKQLAEQTGQQAIETLWALYQCGGFDKAAAEENLEHADPYVRLWCVRLLAEQKSVSPELSRHLAELAYREPHVEVRSQLACSARRLPPSQGLPIVASLLQRSEDAGDIHIPLLLWWAIESNVNLDGEAVLSLLSKKESWDLPMVREHILERLMRRLSSTGSRRDFLLAAKLLDAAPSSDHASRVVKGFEKAFEGRAVVGLPDTLTAALAKAGGGSLSLQLRQGDAAAWKKAASLIGDEKQKSGQRVELIEVVGQTKIPGGRDVLLKLLKSRNESVRQASLYALQNYSDREIGARVTEVLPAFSKDTFEAGLALLSSRPEWSLELLSQIDGGKLLKEKVPMHFVRRAQLHSDERVDGLVKKIWGDIQGAATAEMKDSLRHYTEVIGIGSGNPYNGKILFNDSCGKCHVLFTQGGKIGPDLTAFKRDDLRRMLVNVLDPSIEIREGYENHAVLTADGRALSGFIEDQDAQVLVLKAADGQRTVIKRDEIEETRALPTSVMPEGLLKQLSNQQIRDLFAYLRATQPLP